MSNDNNKVVVTVGNNTAKVTSPTTTTKVSTSQSSTVENAGKVIVSTSIADSTVLSTGVGAKGDAGLAFKGTWNAGISYDSGDIVEYEGSSYVAPQGVSAGQNAPDTNDASWSLLVSRGEQGAAGADSTVTGPPGESRVGPAGDDGLDGEKGDKGDRGMPGQRGPEGSDGVDSTVPGPQGLRGPKGDDSTVAGPKGEDSTVEGPEGPEGPKGDTGDTGADSIVPGPRGLRGLKGDEGKMGADSTVPGLKGDDGNEGPGGDKGDTGDAFVYSDFTTSQLTGLTGPRGIRGIQGEDGVQGPSGEDSTVEGPGGPKGNKGDTGDAFKYSDFTTSQLTGLTGPRGVRGLTGEDSTVAGPKGDDSTVEGPGGPKGNKGDTGDAFEYSDFTTDQLSGLTGPRGTRGLKGPAGDPFEYEDFTLNELTLLKGPKGDDGVIGPKGPDGETSSWRSGAADPYQGFPSGDAGDFYFETDSKIFWEFRAGASQQPGGEWVEIASLPGQFADTPNRGNTLGLDFITEGGVVRGIVDATGISGGGGTSTSVGILDLPGLNATAISANIVLTDGRCSGPNDLGDNAFLDNFETENSCITATSLNTWSSLPVGDAFLAKEIGTHVVSEDEVTNGIRGILQVSILSVEDVDLSTINFTVELGGATQVFQLPSHGGIVDLDLTPTSAGAHTLTISKDTGGIVKGSFAVVLNNEGGSVLIKPAVRESLDELYDLTFEDTSNTERLLGVDFEREVRDTDDDVDIISNRDFITATVNTASLNLSVPGFEHEGTTGVIEVIPEKFETNTITYGGVTASSVGPGEKELTRIIINENAASGTSLTINPTFVEQTTDVDGCINVIYDDTSELYFATGNSLEIYTSSDALLWNRVYARPGADPLDTIGGIAYNGTTYVAGANTEGLIITSTNGTSWTEVSAANRGGLGEPNKTTIRDIIYDGFLFHTISESGATFFRSADGTVWFETAVNLGNNDMAFDLDDVSSSRLRVCAVNGTNRIRTSINGFAWTERIISTGTVGIPTSITYGDGLWVIGTSIGKIFTSTSGTANWTERTTPLANSSRINKGSYGDGLYILSVQGGSYLTSNNGIDWTERAVEGSTSFLRAIYAGDNFFLTGQSGNSSFWRSPEVSGTTTITVTIPEHLDSPVVVPIPASPVLGAEAMADLVRSAIIAANPTSLTIKTKGDTSVPVNMIEYESGIAQDVADTTVLVDLGSATPTVNFAVVSVIVAGLDNTNNTVQDILNISNVDTTSGRHNVSELSVSLGFSLTGNNLRDAIQNAFGSGTNQITGYSVNSGNIGNTLRVTSLTGGSESNLIVSITSANDSTAGASSVVASGDEGVAEFVTGDLTSLIYGIQGESYTVTFPSGISTSNQQALFARSIIDGVRGTSTNTDGEYSDGTKFVMSVNGALLNFRVPEGIVTANHSVTLNGSYVSNSDPAPIYTGGTLVDAVNPVGTYVLPEVVSNVLALTEFRDTVNTAISKGVDFTEDKSSVIGTISYTWNDYATGGLVENTEEDITTDSEGATIIKIKFSTLADGQTVAYVYRKIVGAGTASYSDIVYAEESLTTVLATRGG